MMGIEENGWRGVIGVHMRIIDRASDSRQVNAPHIFSKISVISSGLAGLCHLDAAEFPFASRQAIVPLTLTSQS